MKKIVNFLILIVVCILPVMVEAKANFELDEELLDMSFLYNKDDKYFYYDNMVFQEEVGSVKVLDEDYNLLEETFLVNASAESAEEFYTYEPFFEYLKKLSILEKNGLFYKEDNIIYNINFRDSYISFLNLETEEGDGFDFEDNPTLVKKFIGNAYDLYFEYIDDEYVVEFMRNVDGFHIVDYSKPEDYLYYTDILDSEYNKILTIERDYNSNQLVDIIDGLIYIMRTNKRLDIYKLDGSKYQTFNINSDNIPVADESRCYYMSPFYLDVVNNKLFIVYGESKFQCLERFNYTDANEFVKERETSFLTLVYDLNFDVETVSSDNGEITYETKVDEDGKSYVELKVVPKDGYSVEEIIVTDINGNRIEVTNNKFYKPMNDVKVEVKYVQGEYLPIPNTGLGKSITIILIGLILISLGFYTINYVRQE